MVKMKKNCMNLTGIVFLMMVLAFLSHSAWAVIPAWMPFSDDFESVPAVAPGGLGDFDPAWNAIDTWERSGIEPDELIQVQFDATDPIDPNNQILHLTNWSLAEQEYLGLDEIRGEKVVFEFSMKATNAVHGGQAYLGRRFDAQPNQSIQQGLGVGIQGREIVIWLPSHANAVNGWVSPFFDLGLGSNFFGVDDGIWVDVKIVTDPGTADLSVPPTFDLFLNGNLYLADLPWAVEEYAWDAGLNSIHFSTHPGGLNIDTMVDDVVLRAITCDDTSTFHPADFNHDCYVNKLDFAEFASQWMNCNDPADPVLCPVF